MRTKTLLGFFEKMPEIYKEPLECAKKIFDYLEKFRGKENDR